MTDISLVIPVFNERENLKLLHTNISEAMGTMAESYEIIFVNDGSDDGSSEVLNGLINDFPQTCRIIHLEKNHGQSTALAEGFKSALGHFVVTMDADLQVDAKDISLLLPSLKHYDLACGYRKIRSDNWLKRFSSRIANAVSRRVLKTQLHDVGCPLKIFKREVLSEIFYFKGMHRFFPILAEMAGFTYTEVAINHSARLHGKSKYTIRNRLLRSLVDLWAVRWMKKRYLSSR
jgi:dolichol-phosphate mannosyltransferase